MPTVKDLELNKFKKDLSGNILYTRNRNSIVMTESSDLDKDAFGRLRVSQSLDVFANKNISNRNADSFNEVTAGAGAIAWTYATSSVQLSISQANNDMALRESRYLFYLPGKGQRTVISSVLSEASTDDIYVVTRTSTSGATVDTKTERSNWLDPVNGFGVSEKNIDFTKAGIFERE